MFALLPSRVPNKFYLFLFRLEVSPLQKVKNPKSRKAQKSKSPNDSAADKICTCFISIQFAFLRCNITYSFYYTLNFFHIILFKHRIQLEENALRKFFPNICMNVKIILKVEAQSINVLHSDKRMMIHDELIKQF